MKRGEFAWGERGEFAASAADHAMRQNKKGKILRTWADETRGGGNVERAPGYFESVDTMVRGGRAEELTAG